MTISILHTATCVSHAGLGQPWARLGQIAVSVGARKNLPSPASKEYPKILRQMYRLCLSPRDSGFGFDGFVVKEPVHPERAAVAGFCICVFAREVLSIFSRLFKEVSLMNLTKVSSISGKIGVLLSLVITLFIASEVPAQDQYCACNDSVSAVRIRRAPVRHAVRRAKVRRTYAAVRPTYRTTYAPVVREVTYTPRYTAYVDDCDCGQAYVPSARVYVSEPVYASVPARNVYYTNGYSRNLYTTYAPEYVYTTTGTNVVVTDYVSSYDTRRIAAGWGHRDGFKDGWKAALKFREYDPQNNGDYRDANNGYKSRFGDKYLYKSAYREGYVRGYDSGWRSINQNVIP